MKSFSTRKLFIYSALLIAAAPVAFFFTNCSQASFEAAESAGDPLLQYAWHIKNTGQKVFATTGGTAGVDLNIGKTWGANITGRGVKVLISDDGVEDMHQDLNANYLYKNISKNYTLAYPYLANVSEPIKTDDNHGTAVAGLIAAIANNGYGSKGVAYNASIVSANFLSDAISPTQLMLSDQADGDYDVFNMSWGSSQNTITQPMASFQTQLREGALTLRGGKGAIYVKAAGNFFYVTCAGTQSKCIGNSNYDSDNTGPFTIMVGALNAKGEAASYSSPGSNLWISSFGGEFGDTSPAMVTTDRSGCSVGFSVSNAAGLKFDRGGEGNIGCSYLASFNGTSSATPVLAGVIALMIEANPKLTWRDVKYILAKTAVPVFYDESDMTAHVNGETLPASAVYEHGWVANSAGFKFHNWYGFGQVDVDAAVAMAKKYTSSFGTFVETDFTANTRAGTLSIPDNNATGISDTMNVSTNIKVESVQLQISATHSDISQLAVELISPNGTRSFVSNARNSLTNIGNFTANVFLSNAFYQESSGGPWTLRVYDAKTGTTGAVTSWSLRFTGSN